MQLHEIQNTIIVVGTNVALPKQMLQDVFPTQASNTLRTANLMQLVNERSTKAGDIARVLTILGSQQNKIIIANPAGSQFQQATYEANNAFPTEQRPVIDGGLLSLQWQLKDLTPITSAQQASTHWLKQMMRLLPISRQAASITTKVNGNTLHLIPKQRRNNEMTLTFDPTNPEKVLVNGNNPMRKSLPILQGTINNGYLADLILTPGQMVDVLLRRLCVQPIEELLGYGRALAPKEGANVHAHLDELAMIFRTEALTGVICLSTNATTKASPQQVGEAAQACLNAGITVLPHNQGNELYTGPAALKVFRATQDPNTGAITMGAKSTKHAKVDVGAFSLHTEDGTGLITVPAIIGQFDCSNDGSIYMPNKMMDSHLRGFQYQKVSASRDFDNLSPKLIAQYCQAKCLVEEGDTIHPGQVLIQIGEHELAKRWDTKAAYGVVTHVEKIQESKLIRIEITIRAMFIGEAKMRGPGKGLISSAEGASLMCSISTNKTEFKGMFFGAPGVIKDSNAFNHYAQNQKQVTAWVVQQMTPEALQAKRELYGAIGGVNQVKKPNGVVLTFNDDDQTMTIKDPNAIRCDLSFKIEASPVQEGVGKASMVMPQMAYTSSQPAGNEWLDKSLARRLTERVNTVSWLAEVVAG